MERYNIREDIKSSLVGRFIFQEKREDYSDGTLEKIITYIQENPCVWPKLKFYSELTLKHYGELPTIEVSQYPDDFRPELEIHAPRRYDIGIINGIDHDDFEQHNNWTHDVVYSEIYDNDMDDIDCSLHYYAW